MIKRLAGLVGSSLVGIMVLAGSAYAVPVEWGSVIVENTTGFSDSFFTGVADNNSRGLSPNSVGAYVTYDFGVTDNLAGADFNVYEDYGKPEFARLDVFVSTDLSNWFQVDSTMGTALVFDGFESLNTVSTDPRSLGQTIVYSFAVPDQLSTYRYVRVAGITGSGWDATYGGFDLDAVGIDPLLPVGDVSAVPEPGTLLLLGSGLIGVALLRRKKHV